MLSGNFRNRQLLVGMCDPRQVKLRDGLDHRYLHDGDRFERHRRRGRQRVAEDFAIFERILGFVPNSLLTMQRRPNMVKGFGELTKAVMDPEGPVDLGFMRLIAHFASRAAGCQYCEAHSLIAAGIHGIPDEKVADVWDYQTSPHYTDAERVALDYALAAGAVPNAVDEDLMTRMR